MKWIDLFIAFLGKLLKWESHNPPPDTLPDPLPEAPAIVLEPVSPPKPVPVPTSGPEHPKATVENLCRGIEAMEGANPANNNPGNCKFYRGGYAPIYGVVKESPGGFAMFSTLELGRLYLRNLVTQKIKRHPDWTLLRFIGDEDEGYAPASDRNNPVEYAGFLGKRLGISISTPVGTLLT